MDVYASGRLADFLAIEIIIGVIGFGSRVVCRIDFLNACGLIIIKEK